MWDLLRPQINIKYRRTNKLVAVIANDTLNVYQYSLSIKPEWRKLLLINSTSNINAILNKKTVFFRSYKLTF